MPIIYQEETSSHLREDKCNDWNDEPPTTHSGSSLMEEGSASQMDPLVVSDENDPEKPFADEEAEERSNRRFLVPALVAGAVVVLLLVILLPAILVSRRNRQADQAAQESTEGNTPDAVMGVALPPYTLAALELGGPQAKAYAWMQLDPNLHSYPPERRVQRFALATLYYSLHGAEWNTSSTLNTTTETLRNESTLVVTTVTTSTEGWLDFDKPECEWMMTSKNTTVLQVQVDGNNDTAPVMDDSGRRLNEGGSSMEADSRRLRFTEMKSLCAGSTHDGVMFFAPQKRAGALVQPEWRYNQNNNRNWNNNRMNTWNGGGGRNRGFRDYSYDDNYYDDYYYDDYSGGGDDYVGGGDDDGYGDDAYGDDYGGDDYQADDYGYDDYYRRARRLQMKEEWEPVRHLHLPSNNLLGTLPPELALLTALESIDLGFNALSGSLPTEIFMALDRLTSLVLQDNYLSGSLPSQIGLWSNNAQNHRNDTTLLPLKEDELLESDGMMINLAHNFFNHTIPTELVQVSSLHTLNLGHNFFSGPMVPAGFGALTHLHTLNLGSNELTGPLQMTTLMALTNLRDLYLHSNQLTGEIPKEMGLLTSLRILELDNNLFNGTLPMQLHLLQHLHRFIVYNNALEGSIPSELGMMSKLGILGLNGNTLASSIPSQIGLMTALDHLWLYNNQLVGFIPPELGNLVSNGKLKILALQENDIIGVVPQPLCETKNITFDCEAVVSERLLCGCNCPCPGEAEVAETPAMDAQTATPTANRNRHLILGKVRPSAL